VTRLWLTVAFLILLGSKSALAHSSIAGASGFYAGLLHPVVVPAHLIALIGLALWLGQHDQRWIERAIIVFAISLIIGFILGRFGPWGDLMSILLVGALALGLMVAAARTLPWQAVAAMASGIALCVGADSVPEDAATLRALLFAVAGTFIGAHLLLLNVVAIVSSSEPAWSKIAVRITGSWIGAVAILVLALNFRI
jgi:urease accessory protein